MARFNTQSITTSVTGAGTVASPQAFTALNGTAPYTVTLPSPVLFPGSSQTFYNATAGTVTISTPSGLFGGLGASGAGTLAIPTNTVVSVTSDGVNYIVLSEDGSALVATTGSFTGNVTANGASATVSLTPQTVTIAPTGASTIDNINIGVSTRGSGAFNTLTANSAVTLTANTTSSSTGSGSLVVTGGVGVSGAVYAAGLYGPLTGTVQTASQTNITSLGTLTGLTVNGVASLNGRTTVKDTINADTSYPLSIQNGSQQPWFLRALTTSNKFSIHLNGTGDLVSVDTGGNVGIGTINPSESVHVSAVGDSVIRLASTAASGKAYNITSGGNGNYSPGVFAIRDVSAATTPFSIYNSNVGINTTSPQGKLTVSNAGAEGFEFFPAASSGVNTTQHYNRSGSAYVRNRTIALDYTFNLSGAGSDAMILNSSGNLGIATATPAYKLHVAGTAGIADARLTAINSTIAATAVDVFVYDTRKDSDRGAWRKRCQNTSWYNEPLNTSTRGSRQEFPAVAVIVATVSTVTIYDGDDPLMPMWMVFNVTNSTWLKHSTGTGCSCVTAMNGQMVTGGAGGQGRVSVVKFITDSGHVAEPGYNYVHFLISTRNTSQVGPASGSIFIVSISVFSVAITVLPGAPVDPYTRLPTPTIAVGTAGGATIIQNDGRATNITCNNAGYTTTKKVTFLADNALGISLEAGDPAQEDSFYIFNQVPQYSTVVTVDARAGTPIVPDAFYSSQFVNTANVNLFVNGLDTANLANRKINKVDRLVFGTDYGITQIDENRSNPSYGMTNFISSKYNTGWMVGNIKGAWLCDSTAETLTTTNLITNPTFTGASGATGPTSWDRSALTGSPTFSVASNILTVNNTSGTGYWLGQVISGLVVGKTYSYSCTVGGGGTYFRLCKVSVGGNANTVDSYVATAGAGTYTGTFFASGTTVAVSLGTTPGTTGTFTAVSVWSGDANRSVGGSQVLTTGYAGLITVGSVTKTLLSAGSDLVAYSGWSTSNYLYQPYNSAINPGTGEYSVSMWIYTPNLAAGYLISRGIDDGNESLRVFLNSNGTIYFDYGGGSEYAQSLVPAVLAGEWTHLVFSVKAARLGRIYINGQETTYSYKANAPTTFLSGAYPLTVGVHQTYGSPFSGSIALVRYSLTAPSNAQVFKMYNDEKELFQAGAKACLYGSSDVITAITNDTTTNLVHVGTSSGRSALKGIRRIENTTTGVSAAISASNSMIAEQ